MDDLERGVHFLDHPWRKPVARLVKEQQRRPQHQRAADRNHLLFAARECSGKLAVAFAQARKQAEHFFNPRRQVGLLADGERAKQQVLLDRHAGKDLTPLGHMGDTERRYLMRGKCRKIGRAVTHDPARFRNQSRDRAQDRAFPCRVRPDDADEFALRDLEINSMQHLGIAVAGPQLPDLEERRRGAHWRIFSAERPR